MAELSGVLLAAEVAELFGVTERTIKAWAVNEPGWIGAFRTPGGHWRFWSAEVDKALRGDKGERPRW